MDDDIVIEPMTKDFLLWRCLHGGPLTVDSIERLPADDGMPWAEIRRRNLPLMEKLTETYGACAIVARQGDEIAGQVRFYPKAVWEMEGAGTLCVQRPAGHPDAPANDFAERRFPPKDELAEPTLKVHCLMAGAPDEGGRKFKRRGIASRMVRRLIEWGEENGWEAIEANSFEDIPILYRWTGNAGITFWKKLGFTVVERFPDSVYEQNPDFAGKVEREAKEAGIDPVRAKDKIIMRLDLRGA